MTVDLGPELAAALAPVREELAKVREELTALRRSLPPAHTGSLKDVARVLGISYSSAKRRAQDGELPRIAGGGRARYDLAQLRARDVDEVRREVRRLRPVDGGGQP